MLLLARPTPASFFEGLPLLVGGQAMRLWSAGYLHKLADLTTAGPFALCRNPLYLGSFLLCLGYVVMGARLDMAVVCIALFWLFHGGAIVYEERLLADKFGEPYTRYCKSVARLLPRPHSLSGTGSFSLAQMVSNREHLGLLATIALAALFGLRAYGVF